ncbi:MAG TPA: RNA polymerase sigma-70 factor [Gemmatimonadaceae bacterium]
MPHDLGSAQALVSATPPDPSYEELQRWMARTVEGDASALELLFRATYGRMCYVARSYVKSAADAEDIVEETFLKLWTHRDRIRVRGSVNSYLSTAVRNTALNHLARQRAEAKYAALAPQDEVWGETVAMNDAESRIREQESAELVQRAIDALPARARETYCLYYQRRLTYAQIAEVMGVSVRTVEAQLVRCVRKLTKQLAEVLE